MSLNLNEIPGATRREYKTLEPGMYPGRLLHFIDIGMFEQSYQGEVKAPAREAVLVYELTDTFMLDEDGNEDPSAPRWVNERVKIKPLNQERAKLTQRYNALDPNGIHDGDVSAILGAPCNVVVINKPGQEGKVWERVESISPMRSKEVEKLPELVNKPILFQLDKPDLEAWEMIPQWIQKVAMSSIGFEETELGKALGTGGISAPEAEPAATEETEGELTEEAPF
jgi:hypothetical protein